MSHQPTRAPAQADPFAAFCGERWSAQPRPEEGRFTAAEAREVFDAGRAYERAHALDNARYGDWPRDARAELLDAEERGDTDEVRALEEELVDELLDAEPQDDAAVVRTVEAAQAAGLLRGVPGFDAERSAAWGRVS